MKYTIILCYTFSKSWLALPRAKRDEFAIEHLAPILSEYGDSVSVRLYDAEAFNAKFSDFAIFETADLRAYYYLIEALRDTPLITDGYITFNEVIVGIENGYQHYQESIKKDD